jgi:hypothetical protein
MGGQTNTTGRGGGRDRCVWSSKMLMRKTMTNVDLSSDWSYQSSGAQVQDMLGTQASDACRRFLRCGEKSSMPAALLRPAGDAPSKRPVHGTSRWGVDPPGRTDAGVGVPSHHPSSWRKGRQCLATCFHSPYHERDQSLLREPALRMPCRTTPASPPATPIFPCDVRDEAPGRRRYPQESFWATGEVC